MANQPRKTTTTTAGSRKPRTAARAASRPPTTRTAEVEPEEEYTEEPVSEAEAQELEATGNYVPALLCGEEVRIIPPGAWRQSWNRLLNAGQVDAFAEIALHPDDYDRYIEIDPTMEEFGEFVGDAAERAGESLGKSRGPAPSSRRTRRR